MIDFFWDSSGLIGEATFSKEDMFICREFLQVQSIQPYIRLIFSFFNNVYMASTLPCVEKRLCRALRKGRTYIVVCITLLCKIICGNKHVKKG
uniref:Uncharacterized protein n=1 Tax=Triticum urartu TaxID=4572 RepID=A0A8R7URJ5_TRIUA